MNSKALGTGKDMKPTILLRKKNRSLLHSSVVFQETLFDNE